jgi:diguanylate cyclase
MSMGLTSRFIGVVAGILLATLGINAYFGIQRQNDVLEEQLRERGQVLGNVVALISPEPLLSLDFLTLNEYSRELSKQRDVVYAVFLDARGSPLTNVFELEDPLVARAASGQDDRGPLTPQKVRTLLDRLAQDERLIPMQFSIRHDGAELGSLQVGISRAVLAERARSHLVRDLATYAALILFVSLAIFAVFRRSVMGPVRRLIDATRGIGRGEYRLVDVGTRDEIGLLGETFNQMTADIQAEQAKLHHQANYDSLTGQPNRLFARERLEQEIRSAERQKQPFAVMFIDLDDFKVVNDTLGHAAGDRLLRQVCNRMASRLRSEDMLARLGGDEFLVLAPRIGNADQAREVADRLLQAVGESTHLDGSDVVVRGSVGIAIFPTDGTSADALMANADNAMYQAKRLPHPRISFFMPDMNTRIKERLQLEQDLNKAIGTDALSLAFQPIFSAADCEVVSVEVLLRWHHPVHGPISPVTFIPLAEQTGLIIPIGDWVLNRAAAQYARWASMGIEPQRIAINISRVQLRDELLETVRQALDRHRLPANTIELEITESLLLDDHDRIRVMLERLHDIGLQFSLDDFGTGYSSLSYLRRFSFDTLKIDRSFITPLCENNEALGLVKAIIAMAHELSLEVVAEGVETKEQLKMLQGLGCDYVQGYYLAKPMSASLYEDFMVRRDPECAPCRVADGQ